VFSAFKVNNEFNDQTLSTSVTLLFGQTVK